MKYTTKVEIDKPIDEVVKLFDNPDNLKEWMDGLQSFEHISGNPGEAGAKSRLKFETGKRKIEMIETLHEHNLPKSMKATYEAKGVFNHQEIRFESISDTKTLYIAENEFKFKGFMRVIGFVIPDAFRKQTLEYMNAFKAFAERS